MFDSRELNFRGWSQPRNFLRVSMVFICAFVSGYILCTSYIANYVVLALKSSCTIHKQKQGNTVACSGLPHNATHSASIHEDNDARGTKFLSSSTSCGLYKRSISIFQKEAFGKLYWVLLLCSCTSSTCKCYALFQFWFIQISIERKYKGALLVLGCAWQSPQVPARMETSK